MTCNRHSVRRADGHLEITMGDGSPVSADTVQCVHCGGHWQYTPGSGKVRGWCAKCGGFFCGPDCQECVPFERLLEIMEGTENPTAVHSSTAGMKMSGGGIWTPE